MDKKHIIWTDNIDIEDWQDEEGNQLSYEEATEINNTYLDDERANLDIAANGEIICIGDIGLWNGRRSGYKLLGHKISNILQPHCDSISYNTWYADEKDICHDEAHHDGINHYIYRILKGTTYDEQVENAEKLFSKALTPQRIGKYTKSLRPLVSVVYGW